MRDVAGEHLPFAAERVRVDARSGGRSPTAPPGVEGAGAPRVRAAVKLLGKEAGPKAEGPWLAVTCSELAPFRSVRPVAIGDDLMVTDGQSCGLQRMKSIEVDG